VISEARGIWSSAKQIRGVDSPSAAVSVSCSAPGDCAAVIDALSGRALFVVSQVNGRWGSAQPVPGIAALNVGGDAGFSSVSCTSPGNCSAGGFYALAKPRRGGIPPAAGFVDSEVNGVWRKAIEVPGVATLNVGKQATITDISCAPRGTCTAGGYYTDGRNRSQAFLVSEANGIWGQAQRVRGIAALGGGASVIDSMSCPATGGCSASGHYLTISGNRTSVHLFVLTQA
jgi:hypothetical protein